MKHLKAAVAVSIALLSARVDSLNWMLETVDETGDVGQYSSLVLDRFGNPHICYYDNTNADLRYASHDGTGWHFDTVDATGDVGRHCDIAIDSGNRPHVSYYDGTNRLLKYARLDGDAWTIEIADPGNGVGEYSSIALSSTNEPWISYYDALNGVLKLAAKPLGSWGQTVVDYEADVGRYTSVQVGADRYPRIAYYSDNLQKLKYAAFDGMRWEIEIPDAEANLGMHGSLALDGFDRPYISYYEAQESILRCAQKTGPFWLLAKIDGSPGAGEYTSIALDDDERPFISYYDRANRQLKIAYQSGLGWEMEVVDSSESVGKHTSCGIRPGNTVYVSYYDEQNGDLKLAVTFGDTIPPGPPREITANGSNPSPWANKPEFMILWKNPEDSSGIARALYRLDTPPSANYDTTGSMRGDPPDSATATADSGQPLYLWLEDEAGNVDYRNNERVVLRYDPIPPIGSAASSPLYSTSLSFPVTWSEGSDEGGSGLTGEYIIRVKDGSNPWMDWLLHYDGFFTPFPGVHGHTYYFEAAAWDSAHNIEAFTGIPECSTTVDTAHPSVVLVYPLDGDTGVALNTDILAGFSEPMDSTSMLGANFSISGSASGLQAFAISYHAADSTVYLDPASDFSPGETVFVAVRRGVTDLAGNTMMEDKRWIFEVGFAADRAGPVASASRANPNPAEPVSYIVVEASLSDTATGGNAIQAAEFFIDSCGSDGSGYSLLASDSVFDEPDEDVIATLDAEPLSWTEGDTHTIFIHGRDGPGNWGDYDTVAVVVTADDDTLGPSFSSFSPVEWPDTIGFSIECQIVDPSWVYDDTTGSEGQGLYLLWDNDGEVSIDATEVMMSHSAGAYYRSDVYIPAQEAGVDFVFQVYACDNDFDTGHPGDRACGSSGLRTVDILDTRGPVTAECSASPNPTAGSTELVLTASISDSLLGNSTISGAEYFVDAPGTPGSGAAMTSVDGAFDGIVEAVIDTVDIWSWQTGSSRWLYVHGVDLAGRWGGYDSVLVDVTELSDTVSPWIAWTSPTHAETDVPLDTWVYLTFTERVDRSTVTRDKILIEGSDAGVYDFWMSYNDSDSTLSIRSLDDFSPFESVSVYVASGIQDLAGNYMLTEYCWWFKTGKGPDTTAPAVDVTGIYPEVVLQGDLAYLTATISDDKQVVGAEYFVDLIGGNGSGSALTPVDSFGAPTVEVFSVLTTDSLSLGTHVIYVHGMDGSTNWGDYDSVWLYVGDEDTTAPSFDLDVTPLPAVVGDTVEIRADSDELLHPDSVVVCSVGAPDGGPYVFTLTAVADDYVGHLSTVGFVPGDYSATVCGYDIWSNRGCSRTSFRLDTEGEFLPEEMVYVWPSPVRGDSAHFHFYVNANADVTVEVFSLEGRRLAYLEGRGDGGREPHEETSNAIVWDVRQVASDVYIYRLNAVSDASGEKASAVGKFAIVR